ncbi:MAG: AsmA family protein [Rhodospirillaceae bacterium]|nr:AsmA family protein [Rhodospirillaceae bacterium]
MKRIVRLLLGFLAVLLLVLLGGIIWLTSADLKPWAEQAASDALGRKVTAKELTITWRDPLHIELRDLRIANTPWGSVPEIITLSSFSADVDPWSLWDGTPLYHHLRAQGLVVVLERDKKGVGNWKFGSTAAQDVGSTEGGSKQGGFALIPKNRTQFPTLLDMALSDALITYRTYRGNILRIKLDNVAIMSEGENTPVSLKAAGAYNNTPLILDAKTQSFTVLRDADTPFGAIFSLAGRTARLDFDGTMMELLDFEGVDGQMNLNAPKLGNLLAAFGAEVAADYPLQVAGHLTRQGDHWELTGAKGKIADSNFNGTFILDEGSRGSPDSIAADLAVNTLDLDRLITAQPEKKAVSFMETSLKVPQDSGATIKAKIEAQHVIYGKLQLAEAALEGSIDENEIKLRKLSFAYAGGRFSGAGDLKTTDGDTSLHLDATLDGVDADRLAQELGAEPGDLAGKVDGAVTLNMQGETIGAGLRRSEGAAILTMRNGSIKRSIIEMASTDLRALFREREGSSPIGCLAGIVAMKDGMASLSPLRLETKDATLVGSGTIDLIKQQVDIGAKSERASTGFFALDLPLKVSGPFDNLRAGLAGDADKAWQPAAAPDMAKLAPAIRRLATENPCIN